MIPFNKALYVGTECSYVKQSTEKTNLCGNGNFTKLCQDFIENLMGNEIKVFLTTSCTASLELAALLIDIQPDDEVILPSFTFVSSVNAFVLRGAIPVMIDVEPGSMNMDHQKLEAAITSRTKAIVPVHYAGVACEMDYIMTLADKYNLKVVEDAAPSLTATYKQRSLGSIGHVGCFSFHETKNFTSGGQGGAVVINDPTLVSRAEVIYDNGTNRRAFFRGEIPEYGWMAVGSNFVMSEVQAAYLWAQLEVSDQITQRRRAIWNKYDAHMRPLAEVGMLQVAQFDVDACIHNAHMYFIKTRDREQRSAFAKHMKEAGIICSPHYVPLHHRPIFKRIGRFVGDDVYTTAESDRLIRLPLYPDMTLQEQDSVIMETKRFFVDNDETKINGDVPEQNGLACGNSTESMEGGSSSKLSYPLLHHENGKISSHFDHAGGQSKVEPRPSQSAAVAVDVLR